MLVQIASHHCGVCARHDDFARSLTTGCGVVALHECLTDSCIMFHSLHSLHVGRVECLLEVFGYPFLTELLLYSIDDGHDSLDVFVKEFTFLETFECDN